MNPIFVFSFSVSSRGFAASHSAFSSSDMARRRSCSSSSRSACSRRSRSSSTRASSRRRHAAYPLRVHIVIRVHVGYLRVRLRGLDLLLALHFEFRQRTGLLRAFRPSRLAALPLRVELRLDAFALGDGLSRLLGHEHGFDHLSGVVLALRGVRVRLPGR